MPVYEYECVHCKYTISVFTASPTGGKDRLDEPCPRCYDEMVKVLSWVAHRGKHKGYNAPPIPEQCK